MLTVGDVIVRMDGSSTRIVSVSCSIPGSLSYMAADGRPITLADIAHFEERKVHRLAKIIFDALNAGEEPYTFNPYPDRLEIGVDGPLDCTALARTIIQKQQGM